MIGVTLRYHTRGTPWTIEQRTIPDTSVALDALMTSVERYANGIKRGEAEIQLPTHVMQYSYRNGWRVRKSPGIAPGLR